MDTRHTACMGVLVSVIEESFCMNSLSGHISLTPGGFASIPAKDTNKTTTTYTNTQKTLQF